MFYIGLDIGTSGVKGILLDSDYQLVKSASRSYPVSYFNGGWSEQNPEDWYSKSVEVLNELTDNYEIELSGISFSGQMHGLVLLDKDDKVIRPALLWNDQRAVKETDYLNDVIGKDVLREEVANIALTGYTLPKILWVKNNEPENYSKIVKVMLPKDYVSYMLTGVFASDVSDLSGTLLFDVKNRRYSEKMIEISGLKRENLPDIYESNEVVGVVTDPQIKFKNEVKVVIGGGDQAVGAVGTATVNNNQMNISLGTSGVVYVALDEFSLPENEVVHSFCDATGNYHKMGVALATGSSMNWFYEKILEEDSYDDLEEKLLAAKTKCYYLPYLSGERSPINNPYATGAFIGLTTETDKYDMINGVIEGTSFSLRHIMDSLEVDDELDAKITGGGSKNEVWTQCIADAFNMEIHTINIEEGPALGAAILAISGVTGRDVKEICSEVITTNEIYSPHTDLSDRYETFKKLYPALKDVI